MVKYCPESDRGSSSVGKARNSPKNLKTEKPFFLGIYSNFLEMNHDHKYIVTFSIGGRKRY